MKIEFSTDSAAFKDSATGEDNQHDLRYECIRILHRIKDEIQMMRNGGPIMDINGNKIGEWSL